MKYIPPKKMTKEERELQDKDGPLIKEYKRVGPKQYEPIKEEE